MIITFEDLPSLREKHSDKRIVFGGGVYDLVHEGHVEGLALRRSLGDILVCGVVCDERARSRKRQPVRSEKDRLALIDAFRDVDYSFILPVSKSNETPTMQVIRTLRPDVYVEHQEHENRWTDQDKALVISLGTAFVFDTQPKRNSTTNIINHLKSDRLNF